MTLWQSLKTPIADELAEELRSGQLSHLPWAFRSSFLTPFITTAGLNAASSLATTAIATKKKKGRKGPGSHNRRLKITNTHLKDQGIDLSKDYAPTRKER